MKILFVRANQGMPDSRVEKELYSLSKHHSVELLGWDRTKESHSIIEKAVKIFDKEIIFHYIAIKAPQGAGFKKILILMLKFWCAVRDYLKRNSSKYDVVHFCDFDTVPFAFLCARKKQLKIVYDVFDYYADSHKAPVILKYIIRKTENYIIENSDGVILCSEARVEQIYPAKPRRLAIIHNSPSQEMTMEPIEIKIGETKRNRLVYVGMLSEDRYLKEIAEVVAGRNDIEWHVAGFGILEDYFQNFAEKNDNVFFYGKISYPQAVYLESKCDFMTAIYNPEVSNHKYAAPNKFYEALMLGKPIIMIRDTGMDDIVEKNSIGIVLNIDQMTFGECFNDALTELMKKPDLVDVSVREKRIYEKEFSWLEMENRLVNLYNEI